MPRKPIIYSLHAYRKHYPKRLNEAMLEAIYRSFSKFNEVAYRRIITTAPKSKTPSERWPVGFVTRHIKLVMQRRGSYSFNVVKIPGASHRGSRAWRAWIAINALHYGWAKLPFTRRPTRKKALALPFSPGMAVPQKSLLKKKAIQRKQITKNPWISRVWQSLEPHFKTYLELAFEEQRRKKRKEKIV